MIRAVLFDLDGTLLDTAPDLIAALNFLREGVGLPAVDAAEYRHLVSRGALGLITAGMPESSAEIYQQRKAAFLNHYEQNLFHQTRVFDGVERLLDELDRLGAPWGVVTNKMEYLTLPLLKKAKLLNRAACVICGDTLQQSKPFPAPVLLGCEIIGSNCADTLMMGDDLRDLQAGRAAGTKTALAVYGYLAPGILEQDLGDTYLVHQPEDVLKLLA